MILFALLLAAPQTVPTTQGGTVTVQARPVVDPDKKICRREVPLGSVLPRKVCRSQNDWKEISRTTDKALERVRSPSAGMCLKNDC